MQKMQVAANPRINRTGAENPHTSHHQMVKKIAPHFVATAWSEKDGVIEAIESKGDDPILCVQWHPELMKDKSSRALFDWLVLSAGKYRMRKRRRESV